VTVTTPNQVCYNPNAKSSHGEQCTKFEFSSFSHSGDILGGWKSKWVTWL